ncbi:MAG: DUF1839 family protein [Pseudomonadota bacterium]
MSAIAALPGRSAASYQRHSLHGEDSDWPEKNCYADLWIELLGALDLEPRAMLPFTLAVDFEGDQWTFFKPPLSELRALYGIDVQELTVWRPLIDHVTEHLSAGKLISTESDAFWLPDTAATDYRQKHTKTTILIASIDVDARRLGYFHNAGYFELEGDDFDRTFRLGEAHDPASMPFFAELVRIDRLVRREHGDLAALSMELLRHHFEWRPRTNPFARFAQRLEQDPPLMGQGGMHRYHAWAFASIRQAGAAFELAAAHLRWLATFNARAPLTTAASHFEAISTANKSLILKGARAVHTGKPLDVTALTDAMASDWNQGMALVGEAIRT